MKTLLSLVLTLGGFIIEGGVSLAVEMPLGNLANMARTAAQAGDCRIVDVDDTAYERLTFGVILPSADKLQVNIPRASIESWSESRTRVEGVPYWRFVGTDSVGIGQLANETLQTLQWEVDESTAVTRILKLTLVDEAREPGVRIVDCVHLGQ